MFNILRKRKEKKIQQDELNKKYPVQTKYYQNGVVARPKYVELSNKLSKTYYLDKYSQNISYSDMMSAFDLNVNAGILKKFDYTIKYNIRQAPALDLSRKINTVKSEIENHASTPFLGLSTVRAGQKINQLEEAEAKLGYGDSIVDLVFVVTIFANTIEELNTIDRNFQTQMSIRKWEFFAPFDGQKEAFENSLPLPTKNGHGVKILASDLSRLILPTSTRRSGVLPLGLDLIKKNIFFFDPFEGDRLHPATITGANGSGKSALAKKMFEEISLFGASGIYIDPEGECKKLANEVNCEFNELKLGGLNIVYFDENVWQFLDQEDLALADPLTAHINWLIAIFLRFPVWCDSLKENRTDLNTLVRGFFHEKDYGGKKENRNMRVLCDYVEKNDKTKDKLIWRGFKNFSKKENGLYSNFFSSEKEFDLDKEFVIFSLQSIEDEELRKTYGYILLYKTFQSMIKKTRYRFVFIDELHLFLQYEGFKDLLIQYLKRCRKYNGCYTLITQELDDFRKYNALSVLKEASYNFIFHQTSIHEDTYKLDENITTEISLLPVGTCLINKKGDTSFQKLQVYLKPYQISYCSKDTVGTIKIDLSKRNPT